MSIEEIVSRRLQLGSLPRRECFDLPDQLGAERIGAGDVVRVRQLPASPTAATGGSDRS